MAMTENEPTQKRQINADLIAMWGLGLFFLLGSLSDFRWVPPPAGYCDLIIACLLLPPIRSFFHRMTGLSMPAALRLVLCFALFIVGAQMSGSRLHSDKVNAPPKTAPSSVHPKKP